MKKLSSKILLIVMAVTLILSLNATVNATAEDMAVLENANGDYLIYLNGHLNDEYSYAITTSADVEENNLNWYTAEDTKGNKVIKVSKDQVGSYLWVKIDDEIIKKAEPINISDSFDRTLQECTDFEKQQLMDMLNIIRRKPVAV